MGSDGEPEVIFVVVNGIVEFRLDPFGSHDTFPLIVSSFLTVHNMGE